MKEMKSATIEYSKFDKCAFKANFISKTNNLQNKYFG